MNNVKKIAVLVLAITAMTGFTQAAKHQSGPDATLRLSTGGFALGIGVNWGSGTLTYKGKNCSNTTGTACSPLTANLPQQTVKICNWTTPGGCNTAAAPGWVTLPAPPAQPQPVGSCNPPPTPCTPAEVSSTWTLPGSASQYIGTGAFNGQVRVLIHTQRWTAPNPTTFSTWGNLLALVYDAP